MILIKFIFLDCHRFPEIVTLHEQVENIAKCKSCINYNVVVMRLLSFSLSFHRHCLPNCLSDNLVDRNSILYIYYYFLTIISDLLAVV